MDLDAMQVIIDGLQLESSVGKNNNCKSIDAKPYDTEECNGKDGLSDEKITISTSAMVLAFKSIKLYGYI